MKILAFLITSLLIAFPAFSQSYDHTVQWRLTGDADGTDTWEMAINFPLDTPVTFVNAGFSKDFTVTAPNSLIAIHRQVATTDVVICGGITVQVRRRPMIDVTLQVIGSSCFKNGVPEPEYPTIPFSVTGVVMQDSTGTAWPAVPYLDVPPVIIAADYNNKSILFSDQVGANIWDVLTTQNYSDMDATSDEADNCYLYDQGGVIQTDTDSDQWGDACDPDFDQNDYVDTADFLVFGACFNVLPIVGGCIGKDLDGNTAVDTNDFLIIGGMFNGPQGPSCKDLYADHPKWGCAP